MKRFSLGILLQFVLLYKSKAQIENAVSSSNRAGQLYRAPESVCDLTQLCCGMADMNCCNNPKCNTVWERKCDVDVEDEKQCRVTVNKHCDQIKVRTCRLEPEIVFKEYPVTYCVPKPLRQCFKYQRKICIPKEDSVSRPITWINEKLVKVNETLKSHCVTVDSFDCTTENYIKNITEQIQRPKIVQQNVRRCRKIPITDSSGSIVIPVTEIVYQRACFKMPVNTCSVAGLCGTTCSQGTNQCVANQYQTNSICPSYPRVNPRQTGSSLKSNCQSIQTPLCGVKCDGNNQLCCKTSYVETCRNVPIRVIKEVRQSIPGPIQWKEECQDVIDNTTIYIWENTFRSVNATRNNCLPIKKDECHNYTIPLYDITTEKKTEDVIVRLPACHHQYVEDEYCHLFPTGDIECRESSVKKSFKIYKVKCNQEAQKPLCFHIPSLQCRTQSFAPKCKLVAKQICNHKPCINSQLCDICQRFRNEQGFGSCTTSSCGNFLTNDPIWNNTINFNNFNDNVFQPTLINEGGTGTYIPGSGTYIPNEGTGSYITGSGSGSYLPGSGSGSYLPGSGSGSYIPGSSSGSYIPSEGTGTYITGGGTGSYIPGSGSGSYIPSEGTGTYIPGGGTGNYIPGSGSGSYIPSEGTGTYIPGGGTGTYIPGGGTGTHIPGGETETYIPGPGTGTYIPGGGTGTYIPGGGTGTFIPGSGTYISGGGTGTYISGSGSGSYISSGGSSGSGTFGGAGTYDISDPCGNPDCYIGSSGTYDYSSRKYRNNYLGQSLNQQSDSNGNPEDYFSKQEERLGSKEENFLQS